MERLTDKIGTVIGGVGILVCLGGGIVRLGGMYQFMGFETITLFIGGIALMVAGCFAKLHLLTMER